MWYWLATSVQSAYHCRHSTENALLKVVNEVIVSACDRQAIVTLSQDISAVFNQYSRPQHLARLYFPRFQHPCHRPQLAAVLRHWPNAVRGRWRRAVFASQLHVQHSIGQRARSALVSHVHITSMGARRIFVKEESWGSGDGLSMVRSRGKAPWASGAKRQKLTAWC